MQILSSASLLKNHRRYFPINKKLIFTKITPWTRICFQLAMRSRNQMSTHQFNHGAPLPPHTFVLSHSQRWKIAAWNDRKNWPKNLKRKMNTTARKSRFLYGQRYSQ